MMLSILKLNNEIISSWKTFTKSLCKTLFHLKGNIDNYTPCTMKLLGGILVSLHPSVCPSVHGLFVSWGATGWRFVINSRANIHVTIDCSTVLLPVLGVGTRQKPQINGSVVLGADESPWPCGTPSWYTPLSWMILSKQKDLHLFSSQYICSFL